MFMQAQYADLTPGKHLVLDHYAVADSFRLRRVVHQPQLSPVCPLLDPHASWEESGPLPMSVEYDETRELFRMWYVSAHWEKSAIQLQRNGAHIGEPQRCSLCYAESRDGIEWQRPHLQIHEEENGANNICFKGHSQVLGTVCRNPKQPEEYLLFNIDWATRNEGGIYLARSQDGLHWSYDGAQPLIFGHSDTINTAVYNPERGVWMLYMRGWHAAAPGWIKNRNTRRRIAYSESPDLIQWSEPQIIITPDELDTNDFYGIHVFRYADYYLGQLAIYDEEDTETIDTELVWSKDGFHWVRLPERSHFLSRHLPDGRTGFMVFPAQAPVVRGEEMFFYYAINDRPHNSDTLQWKNNVHLLRGRLRTDGMISLSAGRSLGALVTRPFTLQSDSISINATAHMGEIVAELTEPYHERLAGEPCGKAIEGFSAQDFDVFRGDAVSHTLSWQGRSDLRHLRGRRLMLRLSLSSAEIYSFTL